MTTTVNPTNGTEQISFLFSEFLLKRAEIQRMINNIQSPVLAAGDGLADPNVVHLFDSQEAFEDWARMTRVASKFSKLNKVVAEMQAEYRLSGGNPSLPIIGEKNAHTVVSSEDLILPGSLNSQFEGSTSDVAVLYENTDFTGRWFPLGPTAMPNLSVMGMHNQISSLRVSGVCLLTDRTWFHGARLYLVGTPLLEVRDLKAWGFNDRAASAIVM
jgi:hypothetical protein